VPDADPTPFVLGGDLQWRPSRRSIPGLTSIVVLLVTIAVPLRGLYRATGSSMEEGFMLVFPRLVQEGKIPNVDFLHLYGPTSLDALAVWYRIFGDSLESQRTFGLLQHVAVIFALYTLSRVAGHIAATAAGLVATLLILTPIGLSALAWHGGLGLALWSVVYAVRALHLVRPWRCWWAAGGLAGLALGFRPDLVLGLTLAIGFALWRQRAGWKPLALGALVGLIPMWWHVIVAGPRPIVEGMLIDPVVHLRPGRELPRPPSWGIVDGALQAVAEGVPPYWPVPAPAASQQLFLWFFAALVLAAGVPLTAWVLTRRDLLSHPAGVALTAGGLFGLGILPQALQRPDSTHLAWVAVVSWSLLVPLVSLALAPSLRSTTWRPVLAGVVVAALMLVVCPFYTYRHYLLHARVAAGQLPVPWLVERDGRRFWFGDGRVATALNELVADLDARTEPGDRLIVGPADLSRTIYSDVSIYYLFPELTPGTYYIEMDPGLADAAGSGLAEEIADADVLVLTNIWTGWHEPNASDEHLSQEANQAVADNFCLVNQFDDNLVLVFERCDGGGGVSPADIGGTFPIPPDE